MHSSEELGRFKHSRIHAFTYEFSRSQKPFDSPIRTTEKHSAIHETDEMASSQHRLQLFTKFGSPD